MARIDLFDRPGRHYRGNLHTHSTRSDGRHPPERVCRIYRDAGYDFLALTDHFLPAYGFPITDTHHLRCDTFTTLLGAEVHVPSTSLGELWHILAVGLPTQFAPPFEGETAPEIARRCAMAGAYVGIVHPAWYGLTTDEAKTIDAAHAVEVYNHTSAVKCDRADGWVVLDQLLNQGCRLGSFASDDAHFKLDDSFGAWVMVQAPTLDSAALLQALKSGDHYSTQGPILHAVGYDDEQLVVECSPARAVFALGRGSKSACLIGEGLREAQLDIAALREGGYFRVVVVDAQGRHAWSQPVWFERRS